MKHFEKPSKRSLGHSMMRAKLIVMCPRWFNDLFLFNFAQMKWKKIEYPPHKYTPSARSGCQLAVHPANDTIFMYGGYAKVKTTGQKTEGKVFSDMWALHMGPVLKNQSPTWEKMSRKGQSPSPRSGAAMTVYKNKALLFGGVFDEEGKKDAKIATPE